MLKEQISCERISIYSIKIFYKDVYTHTHTCCHVSIVLKIYLFNHCEKHNLDANRRVSSNLSLSNGQNRVEESSRTKKSLLHVYFDFPSLLLHYSISHFIIILSLFLSLKRISRTTGFADSRGCHRADAIRRKKHVSWPRAREEEETKRKIRECRIYAKYRMNDRATFFLKDNGNAQVLSFVMYCFVRPTLSRIFHS